MKWEKGQSGNPAGRPVGAKSRKTLLKEKIVDNITTLEGIANLIGDYTNGAPSSAHSLASDFNDPSITPRDRLLIAEKFCQYVFPKRQSSNVDMNVAADTTLASRLASLAKDD